MKYPSWKIAVACIVVFTIMSPQNAAAAITMKIDNINQKLCIAKHHTRNYMKGVAKRYAYDKLKDLGWSEYEWKSLLTLWTRESRWDYKADNPKSTAYGIAQILDYPRNTSIKNQVDDGIKYIVHRYSKPSLALKHHLRVGWY